MILKIHIIIPDDVAKKEGITKKESGDFLEEVREKWQDQFGEEGITMEVGLEASS